MRLLLARLPHQLTEGKLVAKKADEPQFVARGMTTRPVRIGGTDHLTAFSREALEQMAEAVRTGYVGMAAEHLSYLAPVGRWIDAEVIDLEDGEAELVVYGSSVDYFISQQQPSVADHIQDLPVSAVPGRPFDVTLSVETRLFDAETLEDMERTAPLPVNQEHKLAEFPPLEWVLSIPVIWAAARFLGAFFDQLGKVSGETLAKWISGSSERSKEPDRDWLVSWRFELTDSRVVRAYIPISHTDPKRVAYLDSALANSGPAATIAAAHAEHGLFGDAKEIAMIYHEGEWFIAWWLSEKGVIQTPWFTENCPDPERFLGRPCFPEPKMTPVRADNNANSLTRDQGKRSCAYRFTPLVL